MSGKEPDEGVYYVKFIMCSCVVVLHREGLWCDLSGFICSYGRPRPGLFTNYGLLLSALFHCVLLLPSLIDPALSG